MSQEPRHEGNFLVGVIKYGNPPDDAALGELDHPHTGLPRRYSLHQAATLASGRSATRRVEITENSAINANMSKTSLPCEVVVSTIPLVSDCTPTPRASRVVTMSMRSRRLRPSRSIFQMTRVLPGRRSARHRFHCGRSALVPVAVSL